MSLRPIFDEIGIRQDFGQELIDTIESYNLPYDLFEEFVSNFTGLNKGIVSSKIIAQVMGMVEDFVINNLKDIRQHHDPSFDDTGDDEYYDKLFNFSNSIQNLFYKNIYVRGSVGEYVFDDLYDQLKVLIKKIYKFYM